ncbi:hypothetical protein BDV93DRAFT_584066 [Ceratobasidium sp. AG-I]|nr:hypothetical protein BDV93DRAFT_584066 [Ceratobasidium sp. AG-I]
MRYIRCLAPFHRSSDALTSREYWDGMLTVPGADLLAHLGVLINSIVPNSMAEERTMSVLNKFNTPDHASQKVSTLLDMALIRQFYRHEPANAKPQLPLRPTVRFADLSKYMQTATLASDSPLIDTSTNVPNPNTDSSGEEGRINEPEDDFIDISEPDTALTLGSREEFEVEDRDGISLSSRLLIDMISDHPLPLASVHVSPPAIVTYPQPQTHQLVDVSKVVY